MPKYLRGLFIVLVGAGAFSIEVVREALLEGKDSNLSFIRATTGDTALVAQHRSAPSPNWLQLLVATDSIQESPQFTAAVDGLTPAVVIDSSAPPRWLISIVHPDTPTAHRPFPWPVGRPLRIAAQTDGRPLRLAVEDWTIWLPDAFDSRREALLRLLFNSVALIVMLAGVAVTVTDAMRDRGAKGQSQPAAELTAEACVRHLIEDMERVNAAPDVQHQCTFLRCIFTGTASFDEVAIALEYDLANESQRMKANALLLKATTHLRERIANLVVSLQPYLVRAL